MALEVSPLTCGAVTSIPTYTFPGGQEIGGTAKLDDILDKLDFGEILHLEGQQDYLAATLLDATSPRERRHDPRRDYRGWRDGHRALSNSPPPTPRVVRVARSLQLPGARVVDLSVQLTFSAPIFAGVDPSRLRPELHRFHDRRSVHAPVRRSLAVQRASGRGSGRHCVELECARGHWLEIGGDLDNALLFGWRHMEVEIEEDERETDVTFDGPRSSVCRSVGRGANHSSCT